MVEARVFVSREAIRVDYGDPLLNPTLFGDKKAKNQALTGIDNQDNTLVGHVDSIIDFAKDGNDILTGATRAVALGSTRTTFMFNASPPRLLKRLPLLLLLPPVRVSLAPLAEPLMLNAWRRDVAQQLIVGVPLVGATMAKNSSRRAYWTLVLGRRTGVTGTSQPTPQNRCTVVSPRRGAARVCTTCNRRRWSCR
jgi:hypothetical protein